MQFSGLVKGREGKVGPQTGHAHIVGISFRAGVSIRKINHEKSSKDEHGRHKIVVIALLKWIPNLFKSDDFILGILKYAVEYIFRFSLLFYFKSDQAGEKIEAR